LFGGVQVMAMQYRLSEVQDVHIIDFNGVLVLELQMKYIRYQLVLDSDDFRHRIIDMLRAIPDKKKSSSIKPSTIPKFYKP
jgi:hypothetical protein